MASLERQAARIVWKQFGLADAAPPAGRGLKVKSKAVIYSPGGSVEDFVVSSIKHDLPKSATRETKFRENNFLSRK